MNQLLMFKVRVAYAVLRLHSVKHLLHSKSNAVRHSEILRYYDYKRTKQAYTEKSQSRIAKRAIN